MPTSSNSFPSIEVIYDSGETTEFLFDIAYWILKPGTTGKDVIKVTKGEYQQQYPESEEYGGFSPFHPMLIKIYILLLVAGIGFAIIATKYSHVLDSIARVAGPVIMPTSGGFGGGFGGVGGGGGFGGGGARGGW